MRILPYLMYGGLVLVQGMESQANECDMDNKPGSKFILDENSWELVLKGEWMIGFCVPLLMACINFERVWSKFATEMQLAKSPIIVASMKHEYSEIVIKRFSLVDLPNILHVKDGVFRKLPVASNVEELKQLAAGKWQNSEPLSYWQHPNGPLIRARVLYVRAIDRVYQTGWLDMDYERATWLVLIALILLVSMTLTLSVALFCGTYTYIRNFRAIKNKRVAEIIQ